MDEDNPFGVSPEMVKLQHERDEAMAKTAKEQNFYGLHKTAFIVDTSMVSPDLEMGAYAYIGPGAYICLRVALGKYVMIAPDVAILGGDHRIDVPGVPALFSGRPEVLKPTIIEDDVWVGFRAVIMSGVRIGRGAVVASGAVVTKDVEPYTIVGGVPAKAVGKRFSNSGDIEKHDRMLAAPAAQGNYCLSKNIVYDVQGKDDA